MNKNSEIKIKLDPEKGYIILGKEKIQDTRYANERKECSTCNHLHRAVIVKENLFDEVPKTNLMPAGVCTLGMTWRVIYRITFDLISCSRLTMGLKDTGP